MTTLFENAAHELVVITPRKEMPKSVFMEVARIALFTELMERTDDGRVIWDRNVETFHSENVGEAEYTALHNDWFETSFEVPEGAVGVAMARAAEHDSEVAGLLEVAS